MEIPIEILMLLSILNLAGSISIAVYLTLYVTRSKPVEEIMEMPRKKTYTPEYRASAKFKPKAKSDEELYILEKENG